MSDKPFPNSYFADFSGISFHYRIWKPDKRQCEKAILLIHGFGGSTQDWRAQCSFLESLGILTVAVDIPSFGYSDRTIVQTSQNIRAEWFWQLIERIENDLSIDRRIQWILGGYSLGTTIVAAMAAMKPEKTAAIIFASGSGDDPQHGKQLACVAGFYLPAIWPFTVIVEKALQQSFTKREKSIVLLEKILGRSPTDDELRIYMAPWGISGTARAVAKNAVLGLRIDRRIEPFCIHAPSLFIWGSNDQVIPLSNCENLSHYLPDQEVKQIKSGVVKKNGSPFNLLLIEGAKLCLVDGAGHGMILTHANDVNREIKEFLFEKGILH
jgi:pimeloyl-ACP methyl ester carboxylesterase